MRLLTFYIIQTLMTALAFVTCAHGQLLDCDSIEQQGGLGYGRPVLRIPEDVDRCRLEALSSAGSLSVEVGDHGDLLFLTLEDTWIGGTLAIDGDRPISLKLTQVGCGLLRIDLGSLVSLALIQSLECERVEIQAKRIDEIVASGTNTGREFIVKAGTISRIDLASIFQTETLSIFVREFAERINIAGFEGRHLILEGDGQNLTTVRELGVTLPRRTDTNNPLKIRMSDFTVGRLWVDSHSGSEPVDVASSPTLELWMSDLDSESDIDLDLGRTEVSDLQLYRLRSLDPFGRTLNIRSEGKCQACAVSIGHIIGLSPDIEWYDRLQGIHLQGIQAETLSVRLGAGSPQLPTSVNIGDLDLRRGIEGSEHLLLALAQANDPATPFDRKSLFRLIEEQGYERVDGRLQRPGISARRTLKLSELSERPAVERAFGTVLYFITGFGVDLIPPLVTLLLVWLSVTVIAVPFVSPSTGLARSLMRVPVVTAVSGLTLGALSDVMVQWTTIPTQRPGNPKALQVAASLMGFWTLLQITLAAIFFSQTTLA